MERQETATMARRTVYSVLCMVGLGHLLNDMMQSVIPAIYPIIKEEFHFSFTQIGCINLVFQLTSSILQPFVGIYIDRHSRSYLLACGMTFTLAGLLTLAFASHFATILLAVALIGCGSSVFHPEAAHVAQLASGGQKGLAQSIFQVGGNAGSAFGPLLAALIILPHGQVSISWFALVAVLAIMVLARVGWWYARQKKKPRTAAAPATDNGLTRRQIYMALGILMLLVLSKYVYSACMTNYYTFYLIEKFGVSVQHSQFYLFSVLAASAMGTLVGGYVGDHYGRKLVIWLSILGAAPFAILLPYVNLPLTIALAIIVGFIISSAFSAILVFATELMPDRIGVISGFFYGFMFGLGGIFSALLGWIADLTSVHFIFILSSFFPLMGVITYFLPNLKSGSDALKGKS